MNNFTGSLIVFKGEEEYVMQEVLVEVTDVEKGNVELGFDIKASKLRVYLSVPLCEVVRRSMAEHAAIERMELP